MLQKTLKTQKGFSLVELMVVVAIIGILAAIAVPQMSKFQAKARQSEAKTQLSSMYTAQKAFYQEYSAYHGAFVAVGYSPEGRLRYNIGFGAEAVVSAGAANGYTGAQAGLVNCITDLCEAGATATTGFCNIAAGTQCDVIVGSDGTYPQAIPAASTQITATQFTAAARGRVFGTTTDEWRITENKAISNDVNGIP